MQLVIVIVIASTVLMLLIERQKEHQACEKTCSDNLQKYSIGDPAYEGVTWKNWLVKRNQLLIR